MSPTSQYSSPFFPAMYSDLYIRKRVIIRMQLGQQIRTVADINKHYTPLSFSSPPPSLTCNIRTTNLTITPWAIFDTGKSINTF